MPTKAKTAERLEEELKEEIAAAERQFCKKADRIRNEYNEYKKLLNKAKLTRREQEKKSRLKSSFLCQKRFLKKRKLIDAAQKRENEASNAANATSSSIKTVAITTVATAVVAAKRAIPTNAGTRTTLHDNPDCLRAISNDGASLSSSMDASSSRATPSNNFVDVSSRGSGGTSLSSFTASSASGSNGKFLITLLLYDLSSTCISKLSLRLSFLACMYYCLRCGAIEQHSWRVCIWISRAFTRREGC